MIGKSLLKLNDHAFCCINALLPLHNLDALLKSFLVDRFLDPRFPFIKVCRVGVVAHAIAQVLDISVEVRIPLLTHSKAIILTDIDKSLELLYFVIRVIVNIHGQQVTLTDFYCLYKVAYKNVPTLCKLNQVINAL